MAADGELAESWGEPVLDVADWMVLGAVVVFAGADVDGDVVNGWVTGRVPWPGCRTEVFGSTVLVNQTSPGLCGVELWFGVSRGVWVSSGWVKGEGEVDRVVVTTDRKKIVISPSLAIDSKPSDLLFLKLFFLFYTSSSAPHVQLELS